MKKFLIFGLFLLTVLTSCSFKNTENRESQEKFKLDKSVDLRQTKRVIRFEKFQFPLPEKYRYYVSSTQGMRNSVKNVNIGGGSSTSSYHNAIDFAVPVGTEVYAAKEGYIINCYPSLWNGPQWKGHPTYGGMIEIKHSDGTVSLYAHLVETCVKEGAFIEKGQIIGKTGGAYGKRGSGNSTGPHLHFSIYVDINSCFEN